jgi:hypothetical protein
MIRIIKFKYVVFESCQKLLFSRFQAFAVTLSGLASGEYLPLPRSEGGASPYLLTLDGCPTAAADFAREQELLPLHGKKPSLIAQIMHEE